MTDIDQFEEFQAKYHRYLSTQQRVSDWVKGTTSSSSQSQLSSKTSTSRYISKSLLVPVRRSRSSTRRSKEVISRTIVRRRRAGFEPRSVSPTLALISSALFVCAILPSLLTISVFVLLLTYAGSLVSPHSRDESTAGPS